VLFCVSAFGYAFNEHGPTRVLIGPFSGPLWLMSVAAVGSFWLFVRTLFEDRLPDDGAFAIPALLTATGLLGWFGPEVIKAGVWVIHHLLEVAISGHAAWLVARSWRTDLVDARRRLRAGILVAMTSFAALLAIAQIRVILQPQSEPPRLMIAAAFALLVVAGAAAFLRARGDLLAVERPSPAPSATADLDDPVVARLKTRMEEAELWRQEGLTIGDLAQAVGVPEHRLRQIINRRLGYRNFTRYINDHRIASAKATLQDPGEAHRTVAAIAFDLGYGSLGPFNRAFRDVTGASPTEWRRARLGSPIADSSNPR
jgi:AraC-like DNA-binding protein